MKRLAPWLLLVPLFGLFGGAVYAALSARIEAGKELPAWCVWSGDRNGLAEAARLFRHLGLQPVAVTRPIQYLPREDRPRLLVLVEPQSTAGKEGDLSESDVRALLRWIEQGNTLLLCGRHATALHRALGVKLHTESADADAVHAVVVAEAGSYTDGVEALAVEGRDSVEAAEGLPLWWLDRKPGAVLIGKGAGRAFVIADPSLLTLRGLKREDNAWLLRNVAALHARDGRVYFDEYHHGLRAGGGFWAYLRYHGQLIALVPLLLAAGVTFWAVGVRLGPAVPAPDETRADAVDYASALSRIYQRTGTRGLLARGVARDFLEALTRHLRLRRNASTQEILRDWRVRHPGPSAEQLARLLDGATELRQGDVSERRLLEWTRAFDQFIRDMQ